MSHWYKAGKNLMAKGDLDFDTADLRLVGCMTNTTADTDLDADTMAEITTLDEYDGSGYSIVALTGEVVNYDEPNNRVEIDCNDLAPLYAALAAGTRQMAGFIVKQHVDGTLANDKPIAWIDQPAGAGGFPFAGNGGVVNLTISAEGLLQIT
jgi:hypothetical protein